MAARFSDRESSGGGLTIQDGKPTSRTDSRFAYFAFTIDGSFDAPQRAEDIPLTLSLSFDERGWLVFPDLEIHLTMVDIVLEPERDGATIETFELTCRDATEGNFHAEPKGLPQMPFWVVKSGAIGDDCLRGKRSRNNARDCVLRGFQPGDRIQATMKARINSFLVRTGDTFAGLSKGKDRFVRHLAKLAALQNKTEAVLADQTLTVIAKP